MHRLEQLRTLVQQRDAVSFARGLDPGSTRAWFDQGLGQEGYGAEVIRALGTRMLKSLTASHEEGGDHG